MTKPRAKRIAAGWESYRRMVVPENASETRQAFYSGAAILFKSLMMALDPGDDPTEADLAHMDDIQTELDEFGEELDRRYFGSKQH